MGVKYSVEGKQTILDSGQIKFRIDKKFPDVSKWLWPKPYEFEDFAIETRPGRGAVIGYYWSEGEIGGEGDDFKSAEKKEKQDVKAGEKKQIGSIVFEGF